jgi:hypothetical protein
MPIAATIDSSSPASSTPSRVSETRKRNLFLRIADAIGEPNRRKAEREIVRFIARNGGRFTDRLECDLARRFADRL